MPALDFPANPTNGQTYTENGRTWQYLAATGSWSAIVNGAKVVVSQTPPAGPANGDMWWDSDDARLRVYYVGQTASQWVEVLPAESGPFPSLVLGAGLTGGSYTGATTVTAAVDAASANTPSKIVVRDASGNFAANTITATLSGNASTATALQTARTINGVSFDGSANITISAASDTLTGATLASNVTASSLTSVGTLTSLAVSNTITISTTPSAWASTYKPLQVGQAGALFGLTNDQDRVGLTTNVYFDTTDNRWEYIGTGLAARYEQDAGLHQWYRAASGTANGAVTWTEAARINASGHFKATTSGTFAGTLSHEFRQNTGEEIVSFTNTHGSTPNGLFVSFQAAAPNNLSQYFFGANDTTSTKIMIYSNGTINNATGTYATISDATLKQDIEDAPSQWNDVKAIRFRKYRLKSDVLADASAPSMLGVVAQEIEAVSPGLVFEDRDGYKGVKSSILLTKAAIALQEAMARIEALEGRVAALEASV